jgi:NAD(P)-dependent dehydrogenase (short-subunit alcohol dehydrogenase family)
MATTTVLITGANRGIGLELVRQYAADGARVHACCRRPEAADELGAIGAGHDVVVHRLDVTDQQQIRDLAEAIDDEPIDILINNAGIYGAASQTFGATDYDEWERVLRTNVIGPYRVVEALADRVAASRERKVAAISSGMASIAGNTAGNSYLYRSSKTALNMVIVNLARDLAEHAISVVALCPGWVKTDMGGQGATLEPAESVAGLRRVIAALDTSRSGGLYRYNGDEVPW